MLNISLNQLNFTVGDLAKNTEKLISHYNNSEQNVDLSVFSELSITSYPAEDLLLSKAFVKEAEYYQNQVIKASKGKNTAILFGGILRENNQLFNVAYFAADGEIKDIIYKNSLPNYGVFDEKRYFTAKNTHKVITLKKENILILICEDLWQNNLALSLILAASIFITIILSGFFGAIIPLALNKMHFDPAISSGVFLIAIIDSIAFFIFLGLASIFIL